MLRQRGCVRSRQLCLLELLEAGTEVERLGGQHEAIEVIVLALERHAAAHAGAHGRHRGAPGAPRVPSRARKADAQAALAPVVKVVVLFGGRVRRRRLQLQAARGVGGQLEVVGPVVVDVHLARRLLLAQSLDGAAQQRRRRHAGGDGDAGLLRRVDGAVC